MLLTILKRRRCARLGLICCIFCVVFGIRSLLQQGSPVPVPVPVLLTAKSCRQSYESGSSYPSGCAYLSGLSGRSYELKSYDGNRMLFKPSYTHTPNLENISDSTLLVYVHSRPQSLAKRQFIRSTWGDPKWYTDPHDLSIKVIFVCGSLGDDGRPLNEIEPRLYRDMLIVNFTDTYNALTFKGLAAMDWIDREVPNVKYIFKTDDDIFVNIVGWFHVIRMMSTHSIDSYIAGLVWINPKTNRKKWVSPLTVAEYPHDHLPEFCSGSGYLMTRKAIADILAGVPHVLFIKKDDPYLTGLVPLYQKIELFTVKPNLYTGVNPPFKSNMLENKTFLLAHNLETCQWQQTLERIVDQRNGLLDLKLKRVISNNRTFLENRLAG